MEGASLQHLGHQTPAQKGFVWGLTVERSSMARGPCCGGLQDTHRAAASQGVACIASAKTYSYVCIMVDW